MRPSKPLARPCRLEHDVAEPGPGRDVDLGGVDLAVAVGLGGHLLVAGQPRLALGLARLGVGPHPLQLALQHLGPLGVLGPLDLEPVLLGLEVGGVVALVGVGLAAVELEDPLRDVVEEVPVVGHGQHAAGVGREVALEPLHGLGVEVVGGLVEQQQVGLLEQELAQGDSTALATGQVVDQDVGGRTAQRVHGLVEPAVEIPHVRRVELALEVAGLGRHLVLVGVGVAHHQVERVEPGHLGVGLGHGLLDVLQDGLALGQRRLLLEHPDGGFGVEDRVAVVGVLEPGHDLQQRRLARAVGPDDADLGAVQERQSDVVEHHLVAVCFAHVAQGEDVVGHGPKPYGSRARNPRSGRGVRRPPAGASGLPASGGGTPWCRG